MNASSNQSNRLSNDVFITANPSGNQTIGKHRRHQLELKFEMEKIMWLWRRFLLGPTSSSLEIDGMIRKSRLFAIATLATLCMSGCSKTIEYEEEVALGDPPKIEIIKRREVLELVIDQLSPKWVFRRSELFLFGKSDPVWSGHLRPLYLEVLPDEMAYLLVAGINSCSSFDLI